MLLEAGLQANPENPATRRLVLLKRMATLCAVLILAITSISAFIRLSNVGLGCAEWPRCYGQNLRLAQQGKAAQLGNSAAENVATVGARMVHRVVAVAALLLIVVMAMACFTARPVMWRAGWMTLLLLALALFLAVLGRWSSGARLPAISMGNLLGGFAMLALCWRLRQEASLAAESAGAGGTDAAAQSSRSGQRRMRNWAWLGVAALLCQIALGGLVSAGYASLSCTGLPGCGGRQGDFAGMTLAALDPWREPSFAETARPPANPAGAASHMAHRYGTLATLLVLLPLGLAALRGGRRRTAWLIFSLLVVQIELGLLMVALSLPLSGALAHNLIGTLLLAVVFSLV